MLSFKLSAELLAHSLTDNPSNVTYPANNMYSTNLKQTASYIAERENIAAELASVPSTSSSHSGKGSFAFSLLEPPFPYQQDFYFGPDFLLRRHDYHVEASGGFAAAQYVFDSVTIQGITLPTKRRAHMRDERLLPIHDRLMVSIDLSDISFS